MALDPKQRTTAEIAFEMNATSHDIAQSVPAPARAIAFLNELRRTNDDLREKLGRVRRNKADGTLSSSAQVVPVVVATPQAPSKITPGAGTPRS